MSNQCARVRTHPPHTHTHTHNPMCSINPFFYRCCSMSTFDNSDYRCGETASLWIFILNLVKPFMNCRFMPFLILSGQLCPPGIEGTLFALFMSINNLGTTLGSFVSAGLASLLNISSGSFDNLPLGIAIQVVCTFIPLAFLFLIPKEATGTSA